MKIYNTTTGEVTNLVIIDRNTGIEWTTDLIGNAGDLKYNMEREMAEMSQEDIDWWLHTIRELDTIEDLKDEARQLLSYDEFQELEEALNNEADANDYEVHIRKLTALLQEVIEKNR